MTRAPAKTLKEIRIGVVGYGRRGKSLLELATGAFDGVDVVAICDCSATARNRAAKDHPRAAVYAEFEQMLDEALMDALLVEAPATHHGEFCVSALGRGIHVFGDVPAVESVAEGERLWAAQQRSEAFYMLGASTMMWALVETAADLCAKGLLGAPYLLEAEYVHDLRWLIDETPWRATLKPIVYCTHSLGPLLRILDEDLVSVSCLDTGSHVNRVEGQHDAMVAHFNTASGAVVRLLITFVNNYPTWGHRYRVYGTKGYFERTPAYDGDGTARTVFYSTEIYGEKRLIDLPSHHIRPEHIGLKEAQGHGGADYALLQRFFAAVRSGGPAPIDLRESLRMTLPGIFAAESAARGGELVEIRYPWS